MTGISQAELARQLGVNKSTITYHVKRGLTHAQIRELIEARRKESPAVEAAASGIEKNAPEVGEGVAELRKKKLAAEITYKNLQAEQARVKLEKDKANLVDMEDVNELVVHLASVTKGVIQAIENKLPGKLEGLTAAEMVPVLREEIKAALYSIAEEAKAQIKVISRAEQ